MTTNKEMVDECIKRLIENHKEEYDYIFEKLKLEVKRNGGILR